MGAFRRSLGGLSVARINHIGRRVLISIIKGLRDRLVGSDTNISTQGRNPASLTNTQKSFVIWNAERLGISPQESQERYFASWSAIRGGHAGSDYRSFSDLSHSLFQVFFNDAKNEVYAAYQHHSSLHFLRMLSYPEPQWSAGDLIVENFDSYSNVDIVDYGCGLAQSSRSLANHLKGRGVVVRLFLVDIPTIRKAFLLWLGAQSGIETNFLDCTVDSPMPELPGCDVCIATEFFEHVYEPLKYFDHIHSALRKGGLFLTNVSDHKQEFMHVSPNLQSLRNRIGELNYSVLKENRVFKKTS